MLETTLYQSQAADATGMSLLVENPEDEHFTVSDYKVFLITYIGLLLKSF